MPLEWREVVKAEADRRGVSMSQVLRERLEPTFRSVESAAWPIKAETALI